jgi:hypothetical protein
MATQQGHCFRKGGQESLSVEMVDNFDIDYKRDKFEKHPSDVGEVTTTCDWLPARAWGISIEHDF